MPTVTPFLWFDSQAEEAMNHYTAIFPNSKVHAVRKAEGKVLSVDFELQGQRFTAVNAGPVFKFNEAVSFVVNCDTQEEVDSYWRQLSAGGQEGRCGWLKDRYGLSWQVVPKALMRLIGGAEPNKANAAMQAMTKMNKLDIATLQEAYDGA